MSLKPNSMASNYHCSLLLLFGLLSVLHNRTKGTKDGDSRFYSLTRRGVLCMTEKERSWLWSRRQEEGEENK